MDGNVGVVIEPVQRVGDDAHQEAQFFAAPVAAVFALARGDGLLSMSLGSLPIVAGLTWARKKARKVFGNGLSLGTESCAGTACSGAASPPNARGHK